MSNTESTKQDTLDAVIRVGITFPEIKHNFQFLEPKEFYVPRTHTVGQFKQVLSAYMCRSGQTGNVFLYLIKDETIYSTYSNDEMTMDEVCKPLGEFPKLVADYVGPA
ncbi:hypothetical protein LPJ71_004134 [Coemansia sp. S17]|nr:hypothetical protein LPJ71_004134 [Coemansia sp. S17]